LIRVACCLDRAVPDHRSLMPFQDTRLSRIPSTYVSHTRLRAPNGYRSELHPDCSFFRNRLVGENPPRIKENSSHKGNRANTAYGRPNPTRNFKQLAHYLPPLICYLRSLREYLWYSCLNASSSQTASLAKRCLAAAGNFPSRESHSQACGLCLAI
jgi:hypothetical protein